MLRQLLKTSFLVTICAFSLQAQNLFVDGAEWHYNLVEFGVAERGVNRCAIQGDTVIQDRICLIYVQDFANCNGRPARNYMYKEEDKIYFFDESDESFKLLYDFSLVTGDTMVYETGIHSWDKKRRTYYISIDSMYYFSASGITKRAFDVSYGFPDGRDIRFVKARDPIIEDIGSTRNFFHISDGTGFCDFQYSDDLRCFSTPQLPVVRFSDSGCTSVPVADQRQSTVEIKSYPNPFVGALSLALTEPISDAHIYLYNSAGVLVYQQTWPANKNEVTIRLEEFPAAVYFVRLEIEQADYKVMYVNRIVKVRE